MREGMGNLRPGREYDHLYEAALCRERADWIVGMNATRLFSCLYGTTLQRDANRLLGFTAQQTLDYVQSLYEKKLVTYPRTDSRYLTEDMEAAVPELAQGTAAAFEMPENIPVQAAQVVNGKKVSDHHAIIPTRSMAAHVLDMLPAGELRALRLIAARFLAAVGEAYRYDETVVELECAGTVFTMKGRTALQEGWKEIERKMRAAGPGAEAEDSSGADESSEIGESSEPEALLFSTKDSATWQIIWECPRRPWKSVSGGWNRFRMADGEKRERIFVF